MIGIIGRPYTNHTYRFESPQDLGRFWQGCQLGVHYRWRLQVNRKRLPLLIFDPCIFHLLYQCLLIRIPVLGCDWKLPVGCIQTGYMDFLTPQTCERLWRGCQLCGWTFHHQLIDWLKRNNLKVLLFIIVNIF